MPEETVEKSIPSEIIMAISLKSPPGIPSKIPSEIPPVIYSENLPRTPPGIAACILPEILLRIPSRVSPTVLEDSRDSFRNFPRSSSRNSSRK